jgi:hypothetical protein
MKSNNLPCPTSRACPDWPGVRRSGRFHGVRWGLLLVCLGATTVAAAPRASNPAFLGIEMRNSGGPDPCVVRAAIPDGPAELAGMRGGDVVVAFDGAAIATCDALLGEITNHAPGDVVAVRIQRAGAARTLQVQLTTRDALLGRVLGKPVGSTHLVAVDGGAVYDLSALHGQIAIIALYNPACVECVGLLARLGAWARAKARRGGAGPLVLALPPREAPDDLRALQRGLDVPLVTGELGEREGSLFGRELVMSDRERLGVVLVDGRGTVQYLGPIAPGSDDADAMLDELFAVADQAARRSR